MKKLFFSLILGCICFHVFGQDENLRVEIETKFRSTDYQVVPIGEHGLVLFTERKDNALGAKNTWHFSHYDEQLKKVWETNIDINNWMDFQGFDIDQERIYLLFTRFGSQDFEFIKIDVANQQTQKLKIPALRRLTVKDVKVMNHHAFVAGLAKNTPVLLNFNLHPNAAKDDLLKILPTSTTKKSEFEFLDKDTANSLINFNFVNWRGNRSTLVLRSYDPNGEPLSEITIPRSEDKNLLTGKQSISEEGNAVIVGTYANGTSKLSAGLFITEFDGEKQRYIRYYNFADMQNFFNYLPEKQQARIERKKERKANKNKDLNLEYRLLVHNLVNRNDKYTLIAEAYYPTYRYDNGSPWYGGVGYYNRYRYNYPMGSQRIFDGFQYTHAVLAQFTEDGKLEWDNSFELEQVKYFKLREVVKTSFENEKINLLYHYKNNLQSKIISGNQVVEGTKEIPVSTDYDHDKVKRAFNSNLSYWYGNYFIAWGFQRIKNKEDEVKSTRNVFYFNKIAF